MGAGPGARQAAHAWWRGRVRGANENARPWTGRSRLSRRDSIESDRLRERELGCLALGALFPSSDPISRRGSRRTQVFTRRVRALAATGGSGSQAGHRGVYSCKTRSSRLPTLQIVVIDCERVAGRRTRTNFGPARRSRTVHECGVSPRVWCETSRSAPTRVREDRNERCAARGSVGRGAGGGAARAVSSPSPARGAARRRAGRRRRRSSRGSRTRLARRPRSPRGRRARRRPPGRGPCGRGSPKRAARP